MEIKIKLLKENSKIPTVGSLESAGSDLYAAESKPIKIGPYTSKLIHTGIAIEIPQGYFGAVFARSGLATKQGLAPSNKVGIIDSDYRGEILVSLYNQSNVLRVVNPGDRIAQLIIMPYMKTEFITVDSLTDTSRGKDGFGSTGR